MKHRVIAKWAAKEEIMKRYKEELVATVVVMLVIGVLKMIFS